MQYRFDMIHHNPGEAAFDTAFSDPRHLLRYGYNGQAFKHINTIATFEAIAPGVFPANDEERDWLDGFTAMIEREIRDAKAQGLEVFYHIDLFVLPKRIVERFASEICDPETGRISLDRPKTLELHRVLLDEIFSRYPEVDGLIIRVGETYLYDTPYHRGNGAVHYTEKNPVAQKQAQFVRLLEFLREEVCVKHDRKLIHRTWDTWPNRFHASLDFYLKVTDAIEPHPNLIFSVKHTRVDFHRWVDFNPCLTQGKHRQVIEVQCQREYEGKGAYPNYAIHGVIEGFKEQSERKGLKDIIKNPLIVGIYTWSRGGGWYGPYVTHSNELWCDLNAYVITQWAQNPERGEAAIFNEYAQTILGLDEADTTLFRKIALLSLDAVAKGKCCEGFETRDKGNETYPTNQWMRDDVLHGMDKLGHVFEVLASRGKLDAAVEEKREDIRIWKEMRTLCDAVNASDNPTFKEVLTTSTEYGLRLFSAIAAAWEALICGYKLAHQKTTEDGATLTKLIETFDHAWAHYEKLSAEYPMSASLYRPHGWEWPEKPLPPGLKASIDALRKR